MQQHPLHRQLAFGKRAGFIEHHIGDFRQRFQGMPGRNQYAFGSQPAGGSRQRSRRGQRQGAGAGNHQQRHGNPQGFVCIGIPPPAEKHRNGEDDQAQHKRRRIAVGQYRQPRLLRQRAVEQFHDMRQPRIVAHFFHLHHQRAGGVQRTGGHLIFRRFRHRQVFAGEHRFIHLALTRQHFTVHRHHFTGAHHNHLARLQLHHRRFFTGFIRIIRQAVTERGHPLHQLLGRIARLAPRGLLHKAPQQQQKHQHGDAFEIHALTGMGEQGIQPGHKRQNNPQRNRRIHAGAAVFQIAPGTAVKRHRRIKHHRQHQ